MGLITLESIAFTFRTLGPRIQIGFSNVSDFYACHAREGTNERGIYLRQPQKRPRHIAFSMSGSAANVSALVGGLSGVDESFWVSPARTTLEITADPTTDFELSSYFVVNGTPGRLRFIRLDENTVVTRNVKGPTGVNRPDTDQWARVGAIPWQNNPVVLSPLDPAHPIRTDPGRLAEGSNLIPGSVVGSTPPALPTQHFGTPWMLQKSAYFPPGNLLEAFATPAIASAPNIPATICTGPFVMRLEPDPLGNACMRLVATVEYEAGVEMSETYGAIATRYSNANNGVVFLANAGYPWAVLNATPMVLVLSSPAGEDRGRSDRTVYITRGMLTIVYTGDAGGIVKNFTPVHISPPSSSSSIGPPAPKGNTNNQFGYGSVGLGAERTYSKVWNSDLTDTIPQPPNPLDPVPLSPSNMPTTPLALINEFLRLDTYSPSDFVVYGYHITDDAVLEDSIERFDVIPPPNLDLSAIKGITVPPPVPTVDSVSVSYELFEIDGLTAAVRPVVVAGSSLSSPFGSTSHPGTTITIFANQDTLFQDTYAFLGFTLADNSHVEYPIIDPIFSHTSVSFAFPPSDGTTLGYGASAIAIADLATDHKFSVSFINGATAQFYTRFPGATAQDFSYDLSTNAKAVVMGTDQSHYESAIGATIVVYGRNMTEYDLADYDSTYAPVFDIDPIATDQNSEEYYLQSLRRILTANAAPADGTVTIYSADPPANTSSVVEATVMNSGAFSFLDAQMPRFSEVFGPTGTGILEQAAFPGVLVGMTAVNMDSANSVTTVRYPLYQSVAPQVEQIASEATFNELKFSLSSSTSPGFVLVTRVRPAVDVLLGMTATGSFYMAKEIQPSINSNVVSGVTLGIGTDPVFDVDQLIAPGGMTSNIDLFKRIQVTYYIGTTGAIEDTKSVLGSGATPDEIARLVNPHSAFSIYVDYTRGRFPVNEDTGETAATSTQANVALTTGNVWLPSNYGNINNGILYKTVPLQITFPGYEIPDFPSSGVPTTSAASQDYVAAFPLRNYGSSLDDAKIPGAASIAVAVGVKNATHDFQGTSDGDTRVNFRVHASDAVFPPTPNNTAAAKALLAWDPLFGPGGTPDIVTITRPNGYRIVRYTPGSGNVPATGGSTSTVAPPNPSEYNYTRIVSNQPNLFNTTIYTQRFTPTDAQKKANELGHPILSVDDCVDVITALNTEFSNVIIGDDGMPNNDSYMWRGYEVSRNSTGSDPVMRIRADALEWGRKAYRYARYIEMAARGAPGPYTGYIDSNKVDQSAFVASGISDATVKLWRGVRIALTSGFLPPWPLLTNYVRAPSPPSGITGFDVSYAGANGARAISRNAPSATGILSLLIANRVSQAAAKAARIATYTYNGSGGALMTDLETLAMITPAGAKAAAESEQLLAAGVLNASSIMFESDFLQFGQWAQVAIRDEAFVHDYYSYFGQLRYDRSMCEDIRGTRSVWGGLTSRISHELWRWALILKDQSDEPDISGDPPSDGYDGGATGPLDSVGYRVVQLRNIPTPLNANAIDARFTEPAGFSFYTNHHRSYGYLLYAVYVAMRYAPTATFVPEGGSTPVTIAEDIMSFLTSENVIHSPASLASTLVPSVAECNVPEPYPLFQMLLDIVSPPCDVDVRMARGDFLIGADKSCRGVASPPSTDGVTRMYPAHRHFDAYGGHSWEPGVASPYPGLYQEASGEAILAYLASYRLLMEVRNYDIARARATSSLLRLPFMVGYLLDPAASGYFPRTSYALLAQEVASSEMYRSTRPLAGAATMAKRLTAAGNGQFGYPVVSSDAFLESEMSKFTSMSFNIGMGRASVYTFRSLAYRSFPPKFLIQLGSQLVPIMDISYYLNSNVWSTLVTGNSSREHPTFGGILTRYLNPSPPPATKVFSVRDWLDQILCMMPLATNQNIARQSPIFEPTMDVQMWARFVTTALTNKPTALPNSHLETAVAFPGQYYDDRQIDPDTGIRFGPPVPLPILSPTQQYPLPLTMGAYYLPQSSWFDVLTWMRFAHAGTWAFVPRGKPICHQMDIGSGLENLPESGYPIYDVAEPYFLCHL